MICPRCGAFFFTSPVLSLWDDYTPICSYCGMIEDLEASGMKAPYQGPQYWTSFIAGAKLGTPYIES